MREGIQYYHRYLALFHLQRYDLVARDTARNLRLFAFVVRHAARPQDRIQFDQYRPYVTMMHARALGMQALERGDHRDGPGADRRRDRGASAPSSASTSRSEQEASARSWACSCAWRQQVERDRPIGPVERLEQQLELAVALEKFEEAARLRDQIRRLREPRPPEAE